MTVEIIGEKEPYAIVTIDIYDEGEWHVPTFEISILEDYQMDMSHLISIRDSIAMCLEKVEGMIDIVLEKDDDEQD